MRGLARGRYDFAIMHVRGVDGRHARPFLALRGEDLRRPSRPKSSQPADAGYPVHRGFSIPLLTPRNTGSPAGACHRAARCADPVAGDDGCEILSRTFDTPLPIDTVLDELARTLAGNNAAVLVAPPGAGKTTRVPLVLLDAPWLRAKKIIVLEPRGSQNCSALRRSYQAKAAPFRSRRATSAASRMYRWNGRWRTRSRRHYAS